ncbi:MAG: 4-hydroxy-3-methylbut-2-enyl diphosphate reductase [Thiotrichaceae bacterium]|nr:4-hydroxy-3-methylbut-2-enyl diphosphate reductase [Thiotrichaceae bacterium]
MQVLLAQPRGFCAGVVRAIEIVERALQRYPHPVYVLHEIVHNRYVVDDLKSRGAIFVETLEEVPAGSVCIFSAHGVATAVVKQAGQRNLAVIDATCPLVTKVHNQAKRYINQGYELVIIGHQGHPEVEGTRGCVNGTVHILATADEVMNLTIADPDKLAYVTQTTLSVDDTRDVIAALIQRFPNVQGPDLNDICYATQNRQNAVRVLTATVDILLVVGAQNSSNSNRLREVGALQGIQSYLIQDETDLKQEWFRKQVKVGVTAGASAPEILVNRVLEQLKTWGVTQIETMDGEEETTVFKIPAELL